MLSFGTYLVSALVLTSYLSRTFAQGTTCNYSSPCPESAPCCSEFGFCGSGPNFCLGGCNAMFSNTPTSCAPSPICKSTTYTFDDPTRIIESSLYDGNATKYDWVIKQGSVLYSTSEKPSSIALLLNETNGGTRLTSTRFMQYGEVTTRMKTGRWQGVVVASIEMSNIKDEIDWEAPGNVTTSIQSNTYILGIPNYDNGATVGDLNDTFHNFHDYTVDWQEDQLTWKIDGKVVRSINSTNGGNGLPVSPMQFEISIWPAGINSSAPGTVQWAGGDIDWNDPDYLDNNYFYAVVESITVNCSALPPDAPPNVQSYVYGTNITRGSGLKAPLVFLSNESTILNGASSLVPVNVWTIWTGLFLGCIGLVF